jgi:hypothetical protein
MRRHIDNGICGDPHRCAVAKAVREQVKGAKNISVGYAGVTFQIGSKQFSSPIPATINAFIRNFDGAKKAERKSLKTTEFHLKAQ